MEKPIKAFEELREVLTMIENAQKKVSEQLKLAIDNNLSDIKYRSGTKMLYSEKHYNKLGKLKVQS